jgi:2'-5' RNA ligase
VARRRLGVVLLLPDPVAGEVHGLRRACADPALDQVPPHLTLVPPVNVAEADLADGLRVLRDAAAEASSLVLRLGPPETFLPVEPVLQLGIGGEDAQLEALHALRNRAFLPPLARPLAHPFVPHVTLCASGTPGWIEQAARTLVAYEADLVVDRLHLLQELALEDGRQWQAIADVPLGRRVVVARGGLEVELTTSELVDPEVGSVLHPDLLRPAEVPLGPAGRRPLVVAARRDGDVLGAALGWTSGTTAELRAVVVTGAVEDGEDVGGHLRAAFESEAAVRGVLDVRELPLAG